MTDDRPDRDVDEAVDALLHDWGADRRGALPPAGSVAAYLDGARLRRRAVWLAPVAAVVAVVVIAAGGTTAVVLSRGPQPPAAPAPTTAPPTAPATATSAAPTSSPSASTEVRTAVLHHAPRPDRYPSRPTDVIAVDRTIVAAGQDALWSSTDGGHSWTREQSDSASGLFPADPGIAAVTETGTGQARVWLSPDGRTWTPAAGTIPAGGVRSVSFSGSVGLAAADSRFGVMGLAHVYRTTDRGGRWASVPGAPQASGTATWLPGTHTVFLPGFVNDRKCRGELFRSDDDGATWRPVSSSCRAESLNAVDFVDSRHGFAVGGTPQKTAGSQVVLATDNGGDSWHVVFAAGNPAAQGGGGPPPFARVTFTDPLHGWAIAGGCTMGENGPCGGFLYRTGDGGHTWTITDAADNAGLAVLDADHAVTIGGPGMPGLFLVSGSTVTHLRAAGDVQFALSGAGNSWLAAGTSDGAFRTDDAGATWTTYGEQAVADGGRVAWQPGLLVQATLTGVQVATGNSTALHATPVTGNVFALGVDPHDRGEAVATTDGDSVWLSRDRGAHWSQVGTLPSPSIGVAVDGETIAAGVDGGIEITTDGGQHWSMEQLPDTIAGDVAVDGSTIWVSALGATDPEDHRVIVSTDAGKSWTSYRMEGAQPQSILALGRGSAVFDGADGSLWRTDDGGAKWQQSWPEFPVS